MGRDDLLWLEKPKSNNKQESAPPSVADKLLNKEDNPTKPPSDKKTPEGVDVVVQATPPRTTASNSSENKVTKPEKPPIDLGSNKLTKPYSRSEVDVVVTSSKKTRKCATFWFWPSETRKLHKMYFMLNSEGSFVEKSELVGLGIDLVSKLLSKATVPQGATIDDVRASLASLAPEILGDLTAD